jgi:hypothetical protein
MSEQLKTTDDVVIIAGVSIDVDERDDAGYISKCHAASVVASTTKGFATGCEYTDTATDTTYINEGSETSCTFNVLVAGAIGAADLAPDSVDSSEIAANAVGNAEMGDNAIGNAEMADNAVGNAEMADNAVGQAEMADNAIGAAEMADNAVGTAEVTDGTIAPVDQTTAGRTRSVTIPFALPAPTGSNQGPLTRAGFKTAQAMTVVSVKIGSSVDTTGSDGTNAYSFMPKNATAAANLHTNPTTTQGAELNDGTLKDITVSQNLSFTAGQEFAVDVNILDDGSAGPTSVTAAALYCVLEYTI